MRCIQTIFFSSLDFFYIQFQMILEALILVFLYGFWKILARNSESKKPTRAPEPSGAWPLFGHLPSLVGKDPACKTLGAIADKYGPIYSLKFGIHRTLVVSSWETVKDCLNTNDRVLATRAGIAAGKHMFYDNAAFALAPYGQYWRDVRKLATLQLLSNQRLEMLKHVRVSEVDTFIKGLHSFYAGNVGSPAKVNISKLLESLTFNINLRTIVGKRYCSSTYDKENSEPWRYKKAIKKALYLSGIFVMSDAIPFLEWLDYQGHVSAMKKTAKELDAVIRNWLEEHLKKKKDGELGSDRESDFMDLMISNLAEGPDKISGYSRDVVIKATALILTLTGAGSTATTLVWTLSLLLNNPTVLKAAQEELDEQVGRERWVEESDIQNLKYLQAIVKETLRLYPPGPLTGIREAMEDCSIGGYDVPKGTRLVVNIWKLHRDPRVWKNPSEFKPDRFLTTHADLDFRGQNMEFIPFSSGRRSCPAINLGLIVVHLTLARILQGFDLTTVAGLPVDMIEGPGIALPKETPLEVVIKPRLGLELY
ncbi:dimethylnonatriene synthase [Populus alba]|nr:dimethylnonatriene synthase-like [Populus alba]